MAKLVALLDDTAVLCVRIQTSPKIQNGRHKQRSGQHSLARQKIYKKEIMEKEMGEKRKAREGKTVLSNVTFSGRDAEMHGQSDISPR